MKHTLQDNDNRRKQVKIILLATRPRLARQMLQHALKTSAEPRLVVEIEDLDRIPTILARIQPDWLIITLTGDNRIPAPVAKAVEWNSAVSLVGISADGSRTEIRRAGNPDAHSPSQHYALEDISLAELQQILEDEKDE